MNDLVEWLRVQLDEDERAVAAILRQRPNWRVDPQPWDAGGVGVLDDRGDGVAIVRGDYAAEHIARHDPARVLRDVEAKRKILNLTRFDAQFPDSAGGYDSACEDVIKLLAEGYDQRPGYREEWRP